MLNRCMITLIRGLNSKFPCPVCLVPGDELTNLSTNFPLRTTSEMRQIYESSLDPDLSAAQREEILKSYGLRGVEVKFEHHFCGQH